MLISSQALNDLMDERFTGLKHFWSSIIIERPKTRKKLNEKILEYAEEGDFSKEDKINYLSSLTGVFPLDIILSDDTRRKLDDQCIPSISEYDPSVPVCWFIAREVIRKTSKNGRDYLVVNVIDDTSKATTIRCWNVKPSDEIQVNKPYMANLKYDPNWGFSTYSIKQNFRILP